MEYSPSEKFEAQDKKETRERGRSEAVLYRVFLENIKKSVSKIVEPGRLEMRTTKEWSYTGLGGERLSGYVSHAAMDGIIKKAMADALDSETVKDLNDNAKMKSSSENLKFDAYAVNGMDSLTVKQFFEYIDNLESSLIK